jgi:uncharacterized protein with HEPN domain
MSYVSGKTKDEFMADTQCQDAVMRRLEVIGEAAGRISPETRAEHTDIPWSAMVGMRNVMIHAYGEVDLVIVWETVQTDLPKLAKAVQHLLKLDD